MKKNSQLSSSIVISVYKDAVALKLILGCLNRQTVNNFEVIISEDCQSLEIHSITKKFNAFDFPVLHLTQEDKGFRKNIALNRAIEASQTEHIIFLDGDCLPHPAFIAAHQKYAQKGQACTGRRIELGTNISTKIRNAEFNLKRLTNRVLFFTSIPLLTTDKAKNIECGIYSKTLQRLTEDREIRLLGCNFSCNKQDLININGFNEDYLAPGIGEDSDIDWRLIQSGVKIKNVKFTALQYHMHHPRMYSPSRINNDIFQTTREECIIICKNGIKKPPCSLILDACWCS